MGVLNYVIGFWIDEDKINKIMVEWNVSWEVLFVFELCNYSLYYLIWYWLFIFFLVGKIFLIIRFMYDSFDNIY